MNKIDCRVVADLLPLYAEGLCSEATKEVIEAHLTECEACRAALAALRAPAKVPTDDGSMLKKLRRRVFVQKARLAVFVGLMALLLVSLYGAHMNAPIALSAEDAVVSIKPTDNGEMYEVLLSHNVAGFKYSANPDGTIFCTAWTTASHMRYGSRSMELRHIPTAAVSWGAYGSSFETPVTLSPDGTPAAQTKSNSEYIYYYSAANEKSEDVLVYKTPGAPEPDYAGVVTLPRLTLNYYFFIAAGLTVLCAVLTSALYIARRRRFAWPMLNVTLAPLSYAAAHMLVFLPARSDVYNIEYYLSAILLIAVVLCLTIRFVMYMFRKGE